MGTTTVLAVLAIFIFVGTLYCLKDTITETLSGGKSFMPAEMKCFASGRKNKPTDQEKIKENKKSILLIDLISIALVVFIFYQCYKEISQILNW